MLAAINRKHELDYTLATIFPERPPCRHRSDAATSPRNDEVEHYVIESPPRAMDILSQLLEVKPHVEIFHVGDSTERDGYRLHAIIAMSGDTSGGLWWR